MTADPQQLRQTLDDLHQELADADHLDPQMTAQLQSTLAEIQAKLAQQSATLAAPPEERNDEPTDLDEDPSLIDRVHEVEQYFESTHPTLAGTLKRLVDILATMGI